MIRVNGAPPKRATVEFFERLAPGLWRHWVSIASAALLEIDRNAPADTVVTSWNRSPLENKRAGGHPDSQHLVGLALDVVPGKGTSTLALNEAAQAFERFGFITVIEPSHVHVQTFPPDILRPAGVLDALGV